MDGVSECDCQNQFCASIVKDDCREIYSGSCRIGIGIGAIGQQHTAHTATPQNRENQTRQGCLSLHAGSLALRRNSLVGTRMVQPRHVARGQLRRWGRSDPYDFGTASFV